MEVDPCVLPANSAPGTDYLECKRLSGRYAYAGRDWVCDRVARIPGAAIVEEVHNHHNFAWRESHGGRDLRVVRKGATPAFPGQKGFVGGTMGETSRCRPNTKERFASSIPSRLSAWRWRGRTPSIPIRTERMSLQRLTLVLNASYEPINVVPARRALALVLRGAACVEELSAFAVRTARVAVPIPSVVRLRVYRRLPRQSRAASRKNVMLRDRCTCQYCLGVFPPKALTLDHVIPRSRGGGGTWENLVACCFACNNRKADRTPAEAGMPLARKPAPIGIHAKHRLAAGAGDAVWNRYLFC
jgi:5-methylcytosine-specific restriction endonuclease McrA